MLAKVQNDSTGTSENRRDLIDLPFSPSLSSSSFIGDVNYCCGSCGYELNLSSCNRNTAMIIGPEYGKTMKRGIISFFSIDESRFTQVDKLRCLPYFTSKRAWGLFRRQTKLLCRNCGNSIGVARKESAGTAAGSFKRLIKSNSMWDGISACGTYDVKIRALRPSADYATSGILI